jgi:hypothetical protein
VSRTVQSIGIAITVIYAAFVVWIYAAQPKSVAEIGTAAAVTANVYKVDEARFSEAMRNFKLGQFAIAADHFRGADPASQDPKTQFLIAYCHYALGAGTLADDDDQFKLALAAIDRCLELAPNRAFTIDQPDLRLDYRTADQLRQRIKQGLEITPDDFNPLGIGGGR